MAFASVIIPVWNGIDDLPACLAALADQSHTTLEIIAVDNASTDGSANWIATHYPAVRLIRNPHNLGFGGACNAGMAQAKGDLLVLLNQDTIVRREWLAALVSVMEENAEIGIAGSKALYPDGTIQHAGGTIDVRGASAHLGYRQEDEGRFDRLADVEYVTGASLALRRTLYQQIGGFDPGFSPAYLEDVDLCWRARAAGWRVVYVPQSVLVHNERSVAATPDYAGTFLYHRQRLRFVCKHWPEEKLRNEFMPAERAWLSHLSAGDERTFTAAHQAYLIQLLNLGDLSTWRQTLLGEVPEAIESVAQVLLTLRTIYPLESIGSTEAGRASPLAMLKEIQALAVIHEQPFHSKVPVFGRLIAAFRHRWNRVSTEWYVKPMIRQQSNFNQSLLAALRQSYQDQDDLRQRTTRYLVGQAREIGTLAQEVDALKRQIAELSATPSQQKLEI
jgi:GT2 family glycosyltransferase